MRVKALKPCFIGSYREAGDVFEYEGPAADWLEPIDRPAPAPAPVAAPVAAPARPDQAKRDEDIASALDLLDEHDFVKTGARTGAPKCSAIENIVGYPVFTDEVDAAWNKRAG